MKASSSERRGIDCLARRGEQCPPCSADGIERLMDGDTSVMGSLVTEAPANLPGIRLDGCVEWPSQSAGPCW